MVFFFRNARVAFWLVFFCLIFGPAMAQNDTVQTFVFSNASRSGVFRFPDHPTKTYEKIKMQYRMRCKNGLVSTSSNRNLGCGEWDYSCNTYVTDSSLIDSVKATHPNHIINGFSGSSFSYSASPTHIYYQFAQKQTQANPASSDTLAAITYGNSTLSGLFNTLKKNAKSQMLITKTELLAAGLSAGNLSGLDLELAQPGNQVGHLRIKLKHTTKTTLEGIEDTTGFRQVFFQNKLFAATGFQRLLFYQPFLWDGTSNLILELSHSSQPSPITTQVTGGPAAGNTIVSNLADDYYLDLDGGTSGVNCGDINALDNASTFTFEAWVNIKSWQNWSGIFKDNGKTVMETGDAVGQLYCIVRNPTNTYGYASNVLPLNTWTHVAMVYDGTQNTNATRLRLFVNGVQKALTFSGTIPTTTEDNQTPLILGGGVNCQMDDARIWSTAVSGANIAAWYRRPIAPSHADYAQLQAAYSMDEATGNILADASSFGRTGTIEGNTQRLAFTGNNLIKNLVPMNEFPNLRLVRSGFPLSSTNMVVLDSVVNLSQTDISYQLVSGQPVPVDTSYRYAATIQNVYNEAGTVVGTITPAVGGTIAITQMNYYQRSAQKLELMSFVTPYGIGLNFGTGGKMWEFDVTDYAPILRGWKRLSMERGGENQEDIDIRFVFVEGTPPRKVLSIQQIWPVTHSSYADIAAGKVYEERTLGTRSDAASFKIRTAITGHGQEGEFIARTHSVNLNGGVPEYQWQVWKSCGYNPVYPQGGTWVYDRAGWCPGAPTDLKEWNATSYLSPGTAASFDYQVATAGGDSRYIASHQLVQYGPAAFALDAAVVQVNAPGDLTEFGRRNPACMNPEVVIQNTGSTTLTSLTLQFGLEGSSLQTHQWTGSLAFMESAVVSLPIANLGLTPGTFIVTAAGPNGGADAYEPNNTVRSAYSAPINFTQKVVIELRTNLRPEETEYQVLDPAGNQIRWVTDLAANTLYRDTLDLPNGCYEFILTDAGNDGLQWWANTAQGTGSLRFRNAATGGIIKTFNADFGAEVYQQFIINTPTAVTDPISEIVDLQLFPNPATSTLELHIGTTQGGQASVEIIDLPGKSVYHQAMRVEASAAIQLSVQNLPSGSYTVRVKTDKGQTSRRFVKI